MSACADGFVAADGAARDGQQVRQYVNGLRTNAVAGHHYHRQRVHLQVGITYVPFFGAFGAAWGEAMVGRWSANPLGMLWPQMDSAFVTSWRGKTGARRPRRATPICHHRRGG
jgi:hypothetical protein